MAAIVALLVAIALIAACLARWTRIHPLVIAALGGVPGGLIALALPIGELHRATWVFAAIVYVVTTVAAGSGAFAGWLRRNYLERNI